MNERVRELLNRISEIEDEIEEIVNERREQFLYYYKDGRIKFREGVEETHRKLKMNLLRFFLDSKLRNVMSAPFIYSMIVPAVFLDITITLYQAICFRLYRIKLVKRSSFIVIDRYRLKHLNSIEQLNCVYCGYFNGVITYACEVAARTEQYWCPIKHARKVIGRHSRYNDFIDFGDAIDYHEHLAEFRRKLAN
ncbi:MAG TPA: hypothetical protein VJ981_06440 [Gammaproteobacteria bacterium]|nr:hypothetical protein [Gammaproteobacteria bacterium]